MDRRSFCKVLGFAAGSTLLPGLMVRAAGQSSVGRAVPDGRYAIGIRSDLSGCDLTHTFYYSDSFFTHPATQYDHQLALATLGLVCAAANTIASDAEYWVNGSVGREATLPPPTRPWASGTRCSATTTLTPAGPGTLWAIRWPARP